LRVTEPGLVVAAFGRQYLVELADGGLLQCFPRGKWRALACGDRVSIERVAPEQGIITTLGQRHTLLHRSDALRQKLIAANATQIVVVVAAEPSFSTELVSRCLVAAEHQEMRVVIVLNKVDLSESVGFARDALEDFRRLGYPVVEACAKVGATPLLPSLAGQLSVLVGQSGMGKSTLINALAPGAAAATREISAALDAGKHTTTHSRLYRLGPDEAVIDSPGLQEFGLAHLSRSAIEHAFVEFRPHIEQCRFRDCRHVAEPDCAVQLAVSEGAVSPKRFQHFRRICACSA
jgi:ribosome biogenesis GTPase